MILLPNPPYRSRLVIFGLSVTILGAAVSGAACAFAASWNAAALSSLAVAAAGTLLTAWPEFWRRPYRYWNRAARLFAAVAQLWVLGVCYVVVLAAVGRAGSTLRFARASAGESLWIARGTLPRRAYAGMHAAPGSSSGTSSWGRQYLAWASSSGQLWAVCLIPYLTVLDWLGAPASEDASQDIYTLY